MNCDNHPDKEGIAACISCGKILCHDCRLKLAGKNYCQECADDLVSKARKDEIYAKPTPQETSYERARSRPVERSSNRFLLFCLIFLIVVFFIALGLYLAYLIYLAPIYGDLGNVIDILLNEPDRIISVFRN